MKCFHIRKNNWITPARYDVCYRCDVFASRRSSPNLGRRRNPKGGFPRSCGQDLLLYIPYSSKNVTAWVWLMLSVLADRFLESTPLVTTFRCILWFLVQTYKLSSHLHRCPVRGVWSAWDIMRNRKKRRLCKVQMVTFTFWNPFT